MVMTILPHSHILSIFHSSLKSIKKKGSLALHSPFGGFMSIWKALVAGAQQQAKNHHVVTYAAYSSPLNCLFFNVRLKGGLGPQAKTTEHQRTPN